MGGKCLFLKPLNITRMASDIGPDKKKHFYVGIPLGIIVQFIAAYYLPDQSIFSYFVSFFIVVAICYGFELFSKITGKGHADHMDAVAGIIGGMVGVAFLRIFAMVFLR